MKRKVQLSHIKEFESEMRCSGPPSSSSSSSSSQTEAVAQSNEAHRFWVAGTSTWEGRRDWIGGPSLDLAAPDLARHIGFTFIESGSYFSNGFNSWLEEAAANPPVVQNHGAEGGEGAPVVVQNTADEASIQGALIGKDEVQNAADEAFIQMALVGKDEVQNAADEASIQVALVRKDEEQTQKTVDKWICSDKTKRGREACFGKSGDRTSIQDRIEPEAVQTTVVPKQRGKKKGKGKKSSSSPKAHQNDNEKLQETARPVVEKTGGREACFGKSGDRTSIQDRIEPEAVQTTVVPKQRGKKKGKGKKSSSSPKAHQNDNEKLQETARPVVEKTGGREACFGKSGDRTSIQDRIEPEAVQTTVVPKQRGKKKGKGKKSSSSPKAHQNDNEKLQETARPVVEKTEDCVKLKYLMALPPGSPGVSLCVMVTKVKIVGSSRHRSQGRNPIAECEVKQVDIDEGGEPKATVATVILKGDEVESLEVGSFVVLVNARCLRHPFANKIEAEIFGFQTAPPEEARIREGSTVTLINAEVDMLKEDVNDSLVEFVRFNVP